MTVTSNNDTSSRVFQELMKANKITPAFPTHLGEIIKDEIELRGIS